MYVLHPMEYTFPVSLLFNPNPISASRLSYADKVHTTDLSSVCVSLDPYPSFDILLQSYCHFKNSALLSFRLL
jgi:hypothetical protein